MGKRRKKCSSLIVLSAGDSVPAASFYHSGPSRTLPAGNVRRGGPAGGRQVRYRRRCFGRLHRQSDHADGDLLGQQPCDGATILLSQKIGQGREREAGGGRRQHNLPFRGAGSGADVAHGTFCRPACEADARAAAGVCRNGGDIFASARPACRLLLHTMCWVAFFAASEILKPRCSPWRWPV